MTAEDLMSIPQAAKELGVNFATVYRWIKNGKVRPIRIANQVYITTGDLKALNEMLRQPEIITYVRPRRHGTKEAKKG